MTSSTSTLWKNNKALLFFTMHVSQPDLPWSSLCTHWPGDAGLLSACVRASVACTHRSLPWQESAYRANSFWKLLRLSYCAGGLVGSKRQHSFHCPLTPFWPRQHLHILSCQVDWAVIQSPGIWTVTNHCPHLEYLPNVLKWSECQLYQIQTTGSYPCRQLVPHATLKTVLHK